MRENMVFLIVFRILLLQSLLALSSPIFAEPPIEIIYWQASDVKSLSQEELDIFDDLMFEAQDFFASEMNHYGFGEKTFAFNEIKIIKGKKRLSQYTSQWTLVNESDLITRGFENQIYVLFLGEAEYIDGSLGVAQFLCGNDPNKKKELKYCNNLVVIPTVRRHLIRPLVAHEIGHALGLDHTSELWITDRIDKNRLDVMSKPMPVIPGIIMTFDLFAFSQKDATILQSGGRLSIQSVPQEPDTEMVLDTDVNNDGYTDLSDCLIVRSAMSVESSYDTDINNDGITNILDLMLVKAAALESIAAAAPSISRVITTTWGDLKRK